MSTKKRSKFLEWLSNLGQTWAMASDPAVMQASGYKSTPEGVKYEDSEGSKQLRDNLAVLSGTANTVVNMGLSGIVPALVSEAGAVAGGTAGGYIGQKIDDRSGTEYYAPILGVAGSLLGGYTPYAASRYWNGLKTAWNSGKPVRPDYVNWGGEFVDDMGTRSYSPIRPSGQDTPFKTAKYAGSPGTYNGKTVPVWQLPKGRRNQAVYVRSPEQQFVTSYLEKSSIPREHKFHIGDFSIFDPTEVVSKDMSTFIKTLPEPNPKFLVDKNIIDGYRNYLNHLDISSSNISDLDLQKLLSYQYQTLSNSATGKLKNTLVFHSSPKWFDSFDLRHTGKHMNNSGVMGPGNYFSREGTVYGHTSDAFGRSTMNNTQPYIITEITSTPNGRIMQSKGVLPEMIDGYLFRDKITNMGTHVSPNFDIKLQQQIAATPINDTRAYIIPSTARGFKELYNLGDYNVGELMIRRNTGIKSLYPHPSRFIKNADGTVTLKPVDWSDIRVNYKEGGKLK